MTETDVVATRDERDAVDEARRQQLLSLPRWTLIQVGWEIEPGRVQGNVYYRNGDGLGPVHRDQTPSSVLRDAVRGFYNGQQQWGFRVLAAPVDSARAGDSRD